MTAIVGFNDVKNNTVYIGSDSCVARDEIGLIAEKPKVFRPRDNDKIIIGSTSTFRYINLLEYTKGVFPQKDSASLMDMDYLINECIPNIKRLFQNEIPRYEETDRGGNFLIGIGGHLYEVQNDYSVLEHMEPFAAIGCGYQFCLGTMYSLQQYEPDMPPGERVIAGLRAASRYSGAVKPPFIVLNTDNQFVGGSIR